MLESSIQTAVRRKLEQSGWLVTKLIKCSDSGYPDLMAIRDEKVIFIEVKTHNGRLRKIQEYRINQIRKEGIDVYVVKDKEEIPEWVMKSKES